MLARLLGVLLMVCLATTRLPAQEVGCNQFGFELYQRLAGQDGNLAFSPFSIATALAMTSAGARGVTASQIAQVIHLPADPHAAYQALLEGLIRHPAGYTLSLANRLWPARSLPLSPDFVKLLARSYQSPPQPLDYALPDLARNQINLWVSQQTQSQIPELLPAGLLDSRTSFVLTNALYFKGSWGQPFAVNDTTPSPFGTGKDKVTCQLMQVDGLFRYVATEDAQVVQLPYQGDRLSLVVVLPLEGTPLEKLEKKLNSDQWSRWIAAQDATRLLVRLPRFKVRAGLRLPQVLQAMGIRQLFGAGCDLSGITENHEGMFVSEVVHQVCLEVNEVGSEAAAATAAVSTRSMPQSFVANRPFLFAIWDHTSDCVLFLGRLENPNTE